MKVLRNFVKWLLGRLYGFRIFNEAVLETPGPILLVANHVSWWDWLLVGASVGLDWRFVTSIPDETTGWLHKRVLNSRRTFPVDMNSPFAVKRMIEFLQHGGRLVLFPEGRLSRTGNLMKLFDGTGFLLSKTRARIVTAYIRNAQQLPFSPNPNRKSWFPRLSLHFSNVLEPPSLVTHGAADSRARLADWLRDEMLRQQFETEMLCGPKTLLSAMLETARQMPGKVVLQDTSMTRFSYRRLLAGTGLLARRWKERLPASEHRVGLLLPNVSATAIALLSLWAAGKVPALLNYTSGPSVLVACARLAGLKHIITSRQFLDRMHIDASPFTTEGIELIYLEDVRAGISKFQRNAAGIATYVRFPVDANHLSAEDTAVVLFTSGSEGQPKGVELTHGNILANIRQMLSVVDLQQNDRFFNAMPLFHSFGLSVGLLLPLVRGVFTFVYISPLHYRVVPAAFYNLDCTVLFGTNTFLAGYARKAHPLDFRSVRYVVAGAERLQEQTSTLWMRKFGVRILEGYGATECSPVVSVNVPSHPCHGSAGRFLPGIEYQVVPVEGFQNLGNGTAAEGTAQPAPCREADSNAAPTKARVGKLLVRGPNIMRGYLNAEANAQFKALEGWYDTGDIVRVAEDGFLFILGRLKRFAKVSGEMVSLTAVEEAVISALPQFGNGFHLAVVARPDHAKGEKLIAITDDSALRLEQVRQAIQSRGLPPLAVPRELLCVPEVPLLGTGKVNYRALETMLSNNAHG